MKNYRLLILLMAVSFFGCAKYLERDIITNLREDLVNKSYDFTRNRVSAIYNMLPQGFTEIDGAMLASATDESEHTDETSNIHKFNTGAWNIYDNPDGVWYRSYQAIRMVNVFLNTSDSVNLDAYRLNPEASQQLIYRNRLAEIKRWKYEVRFIRAFFYFELIKRYGGVPIITEIYSLNDDPSTQRRNTLAESIKYVVDECDSAAANLPVTYTSDDLGRATKGAALALKSRMLLYAASDLFNNVSWAQGYGNPELVSMPAGDREAKWEAAADAAKAVIDLAGSGYALHSDYSALFRTFNSPEIIFTRRAGASNNFERASFPVGYEGQSGTTPSQNLVDAYEVKVSSSVAAPFDWNNSAHAANPYAGRDPRLGFTVLLNNTTFKGRPVESFIGGLDGLGNVNATRTGYYLRKYVDESVTIIGTATSSVHSWIFIRLAEVYLNYAEALNEYSPGHADIKTYVDRVRTRSGVAMPVLPSGLTQAQMRDRIRNERRVELAFEGHRAWDTRRWMIGAETLGATLRGIRIERGSTGSFTYAPFNVEPRAFEPKMYLYPIPQQELLKAEGLVQNPIW